jgi:imidazolonepropionase-like amidohydrolase
MRLTGLLFACAAMALAGSDDTFLIRGIDVYPVTSKPIQSVSVLIQDGKIAEISAKIVPPKGMKIVEGKGLRLYPGMIDSATNLGLQEVQSVRETVDTGEGGDFLPQLRALVAVNPESEHFGAVRVNGITSAITLPGGGGGRGGGGQSISGQAALIHTSGWTWEDMEISRSAAMQMTFPSMGGRGGRGGGGITPEMIAELIGGDAAAGAGGGNARRQYEDAIAKINTFFDDARRYKNEKAANPSGFVPNLKMEAMIPVLDGKTPLAISASTSDTIHDAIQFADKQHVKIVIMGPREVGKAGAELKAHNIPVILGRVLALPEREDDSYDQAMALPNEFYKAGIKFALGTFTNEFIRNIPYQAATAVAFGLPADEALKAVTINPAEIWGQAEKIGSIEKGKLADLVITNGDLLEIQTKIEHVYIKGKEVDLTNKQTRLADKYMSRQ